VVAVTRILPSEAIYEEIELNGTPGIVVRLATVLWWRS
jgi:hypothetical protein